MNEVKEGVRVKRLEWHEIGAGLRIFHARTILNNNYRILGQKADKWEVLFEGDRPFEVCTTLEAAKAAAQSDFDARIRSAIERKAEPAAWRWRLRGAQVWIYDPSSEWLDKHCADQGVEIEPLYSTLPAVPTPTPAMIEAAWQAYQNCPVDLCGDHDEEQKKSVVAALCAAFSASPSPVDSRDGLIERLVTALEPFEAARHELSYMRADDVPLSDTVAGEILTCGQLREACAAYREARALFAAKEQQP